MNLPSKPLKAVTLFISYVLGMYVFSNRLNELLGDNSSIYFEIFFIIVAILGFKTAPKFKPLWNRRLFLIFLSSAVSGALVAFLTKPLQLSLPFDFNDRQLVLYAILIAPILEEFIFRFVLYKVFESIQQTQKHVALFTTILFSASHFFAYFFVPAEFRAFIVYQTIYTLFLGWQCACSKRDSDEVLSPLIVHILFNLGFVSTALNLI